MKTILPILLCAISIMTFSQSDDQENLDKYWKYRDQLRKHFMRIGTEEGYSIPASVIIPNRQYGQTDQTTGSIIQWRDATISLGYYWIVLAIEFKLLSQNNQDTLSTLNELYYAMRAFNRLDMTAEGYLSGDLQTQANPSDLNGFFIREDVHHSITQNFANDLALTNGPIQPDAGHPNQMRSDFEGWTNYDTGGMGDEAHTTEIQPGSSESLDHLTSVLLGLHCIQRMVPDIWVQPTSSDEGYFIRTEALAMIKRIVEYLNDTEPNWANQYSAKEWTLLQGDDLVVNNGGSNCVLASYPITELMKALFDSEESEMIGEPGEVRLQFRLGEMCTTFDYPNNPIAQNLNINIIMEAVQGMINALLMSAGNVVLAETINPILAPELMIQGFAWAETHCTSNISCCEAVDGPVIVEITNNTIRKIWEKLENNNFPLHAGANGTVVLPTGDLFIKLDGVISNLPAFLPIPIADKMIDDDNVHIMHELAILGNIWGPEYIRDNAYASGMVHLPMLYDVLNANGVRVSTNYSKGYYASLLNLAPCEGPYADPYNFLNVAEEWASANRLFHPGDRYTGAYRVDPINDNTLIINPDPEYRGYFPGIDYMLIYNLYHLLWKTELPAYHRTTACECITEITDSEEIWSALDINPKFPDYKAKNIPIESYLAHDLAVSSASGILNVKNDLIICRENPNIPTTLTITDGAVLNLYGGNTITVRAGNKIILDNASSLIGGISDSEQPGFTLGTIHFEAGAELHVLNGSILECHEGLSIIMDEGAKFIVDDSEILVSNTSADNHFVLQGENISFNMP